MILDFTNCKTVNDVNKKWIKYAKDMKQYKKLIKDYFDTEDKK